MTALEMTTLKITYLCPCFFRKGIMIRWKGILRSCWSVWRTALAQRGPPRL
jgi:hypothetical protein